jgi:cellulose synthase operon protein C
VPVKLRCVPLVAFAILALTACAPKGEALYARAEQALDKGEARAAVIDLKNLVESEPQNAKARALLGRALVQSGDVQAGAIELQKARDLGAPPEMVLVPECRVLVAQREFDKALAQCKPEAAPASAKFEMQIVQGRALMGLGRAADAKGAFQASLAARPDSLEALLGLAGATNATDGLAAAQAVLDKAPAEAKERAGYWITVGAVDTDGGDLAGAERAFETAVERTGKAGDSTERLTALGSLAEVQLRQGKLKEAKATSEQLMKEAPNNPLVKQLRGQVLAAGGDLDQARTLLEEVVAAMPDNDQARIALAMVDLRQGNLGQAEQQLSYVVAHQPNNVQAQTLLAEIRARLQTPAETLEGLKPALAQQSANPSILVMAGRLSLESGDRNQALAYLAQAAGQPGEQKSPNQQLEIAGGYLMAGDLDRAIELLEAMPVGGATGNQREYLLMVALLRKGEKGEAVATARSLLERSGNDPAVRNLVGGVFIAAGQRDAGREQFNEALKLKPNDSTALLNLGRLDLVDGKTADAEQAFRKVLEADPKNMVATVGLAATSGAKGDRKEAEKWLQKAAADHPDSIEAQLALAQFYIGTRDYGKARAVIDAAAKRSPKNAALSNAGGMALLGLKDLPGALASFKQATEQAPNDYGYTLNLARAYLAGGDLDDALNVTNGILKKDPKFVPALAFAAAACLVHGGELEKATGYVERLSRAAPDAPGTLAIEGDLAMAQKRYREALDYYRKASARGASSALVIAQYRAATQAGTPDPEKVLEDWVAAHPEDGAALMVLAEARQRKGDLDGAARLYEQVLLKSPGNPVLLNNLAVLYQAKGNPKALELAEKAYKAAPRSPAIQDTYGWILFNNGRTDEAAGLLADAAKGLPDNAEVLYHYASVLAKQGKSAEAAALLKKAVKGPLPPDAEADARKLLQQVSR